MKTLRHSALIFPLLFALGCSREEPVPDLAPRGEIVLASYTLNNQHFRRLADGATRTGRRLGFRVRCVSAEFDSACQTEQVRQAVAMGVRAILLAPCDLERGVDVLAVAEKAGVPVFTIDTACPAAGRRVVAHIATDNYGGGKQLAHAVIDALGARGGRVALVDNPAIEACQERVRGFRDVLDHAPGVSVVQRFNGGATYTGGRAAAISLVAAGPMPDAIFAVNDPSALGLRSVLKDLPKEQRPLVVSFDASEEGRREVRKRRILATAVQRPERIGDEAVRAIDRHLRGEAVPAEILIPTELYMGEDE